jgi:hypothetical protein
VLRLELIESVVQVYGGRAGPPPLPPSNIGLCSCIRESRPSQVASSSVRTCLLADVLMTDGIHRWVQPTLLAVTLHSLSVGSRLVGGCSVIVGETSLEAARLRCLVPVYGGRVF